MRTAGGAVNIIIERMSTSFMHGYCAVQEVKICLRCVLITSDHKWKESIDCYSICLSAAKWMMCALCARCSLCSFFSLYIVLTLLHLALSICSLLFFYKMHLISFWVEKLQFKKLKYNQSVQCERKCNKNDNLKKKYGTERKKNWYHIHTESVSYFI